MAQVIDISGRLIGNAHPANRSFKAFEVADQRETSLFFVFRDQNRYLVLWYADLESIGSATGQDCNRVVLMRFGHSVNVEVRIEGERLMELVNYLRWHKVSWIEETPEAWSRYGDGSVVVSRISVTEFKR